MNGARDFVTNMPSGKLDKAFAYDDSVERSKRPRGRLPSVLQLADEGILMVDETMHITVANRGAEKIFGYDAGELLGKPLDILLPPRFIPTHHQHVQDFMENSDEDRFREMADHSDVFGLRKDGSEFPLEASISRSERDGVRSYAVILRDITARKEAEGQQELAAERERSTLLAEIIDDITHDLKTPISVIHANIYLMQHATDPEDSSRRLNAIIAATEQMEHLANVLSSVSHLEDGRQPDFELVVANDLIRNVAGHFAARADECGIELYVDLAHELPDIIGSEHELMRALGNLVRNAIRHTPIGGVITLYSRCENGGVVITVEDTGEGIHPDAMPHIFERYYRAKHTRKAHLDGSGLGLSITGKIVEMHAGTISVDSTFGKGSAFTIWLPGA